MITKWLASVESLEEAQLLVEQLPDILDMKNPSKGALGALTHQTVTQIVKWINKRCLCSATVGDLPMQAEIISAAIRSMADTGVDYVKVGLFDESGLIQCIQQLEPTIRSLKKPVIAVIFADQLPQQKLISLLAKSGFAGVMLDTASKDGQGLLNHLSVETLQQFVVEAKSAGLLCGLAGALRIEDIETLSPLQADYLGFRSALCQQHRRTNRLDPYLAKQIHNQLNAALPNAKAS
jgi:(5-formylfuran-3-yl)methyl phosphate synthase|tara:strand:- start:6915 stop:7622 length:708 start_codon:yes stop_codon:yes gene_type:complete